MPPHGLVPLGLSPFYSLFIPVVLNYVQLPSCAMLFLSSERLHVFISISRMYLLHTRTPKSQAPCLSNTNPMSQFYCYFLLEFFPYYPQDWAKWLSSHSVDVAYSFLCVYNQSERFWKQKLYLVYHLPSSPYSPLTPAPSTLVYCRCSVHICHMDGQKGLKVLRRTYLFS